MLKMMEAEQQAIRHTMAAMRIPTNNGRAPPRNRAPSRTSSRRQRRRRCDSGAAQAALAIWLKLDENFSLAATLPEMAHTGAQLSPIRLN
jgi:hypothetical protein